MGPWTEAETELLRRLEREGLTITEAARHFPNRSRETVRHKAKRLGLRFRRARPLMRQPNSWVPNIDLMHHNSFDGFSDLSRYGYELLDEGLEILARHVRDGHVVYGGAKMPIFDAVGSLLSEINRAARAIREAGVVRDREVA